MTSLGGALEVDLLKIFSMKLNNEFIHPLVDLTVLFLVKVTGWSVLFGLKITMTYFFEKKLRNSYVI